MIELVVYYTANESKTSDKMMADGVLGVSKMVFGEFGVCGTAWWVAVACVVKEDDSLPKKVSR